MTDKMPERIYLKRNSLGNLQVWPEDIQTTEYIRADLVRPAAGEDFDLVEKALEKLAMQSDQVLGNNAAIAFGRIRNSLVRGNVDVEVQKALDHYDLLIKRAVSTGFCGSDETISARKYLQLLKDHLAANGWLNAGWQTIDKHTGHKAVIIGRWNGHAWEYVHYAYFQNDLWFLPFDSERDKHGTPTLNGDELPTHFQPVWYSPEAP